MARGLTEQTSRVYPKQEYFLYVPKSYDGSVRYRLLVVVHGDGRHVKEYTKQFTDFADEKRYIILAPHFPAGERFQQLGIGEKRRRSALTSVCSASSTRLAADLTLRRISSTCSASQRAASSLIASSTSMPSA